MYRDVDGGRGIPDNKGGNSNLANRKEGIPDWVPFHFGGSNKRYYVDYTKKGVRSYKSAVLPHDVFNMYGQYLKK